MANDGETRSEVPKAIEPGLAEARRQYISQEGDGNIGATADHGSTISISIFKGLSGLELVSGRRAWVSGLTDSALLRSDYAIVPFHPARRPAVEDLLAWCTSDAPRAVRLVHERGGVGKTRLLIEVVEQLNAAGWAAGFLKLPALGESPPEAAYTSLFPADRPVCIVLDYAESRRLELVPLLRALRNCTGPRSRIVLLAGAAGEWWDGLAISDAEAQEVMESWAEARSLPPLDDTAALRSAIFHDAVAEFAQRLGLSVGSMAGATAPEFSTFLFLHLAALATVRGQPIGDADRLLRWVLDRERRAWARGLRDAGLPEHHAAIVGQTVTLATLAHSVPEETALRQLVDRAPLVAGAGAGADATTRERISAIVARLYPDATQLGALRPDLLGEELVATEIERPGMVEAALGSAVPPASLRTGLTVLTRHARRRDTTKLLDAVLSGRLNHLAPPAIAVSIETGDPLGKVLAEFIEKGPIKRPDLLERLLPEKTLALREAGAAIMQKMLARLPSIDNATEAALIERARVAQNLSLIHI